MQANNMSHLEEGVEDIANEQQAAVEETLETMSLSPLLSWIREILPDLPVDTSICRDLLLNEGSYIESLMQNPAVTTILFSAVTLWTYEAPVPPTPVLPDDGISETKKKTKKKVLRGKKKKKIMKNPRKIRHKQARNKKPTAGKKSENKLPAENDKTDPGDASQSHNEVGAAHDDLPESLAGDQTATVVAKASSVAASDHQMSDKRSIVAHETASSPAKSSVRSTTLGKSTKVTTTTATANETSKSKKEKIKGRKLKKKTGKKGKVEEKQSGKKKKKKKAKRRNKSPNTPKATMEELLQEMAQLADEEEGEEGIAPPTFISLSVEEAVPPSLTCRSFIAVTADCLVKTEGVVRAVLYIYRKDNTLLPDFDDEESAFTKLQHCFYFGVVHRYDLLRDATKALTQVLQPMFSQPEKAMLLDSYSLGYVILTLHSMAEEEVFDWLKEKYDASGYVNEGEEKELMTRCMKFATHAITSLSSMKIAFAINMKYIPMLKAPKSSLTATQATVLERELIDISNNWIENVEKHALKTIIYNDFDLPSEMLNAVIRQYTAAIAAAEASTLKDFGLAVTRLEGETTAELQSGMIKTRLTLDNMLDIVTNNNRNALILLPLYEKFENAKLCETTFVLNAIVLNLFGMWLLSAHNKIQQSKYRYLDILLRCTVGYLVDKVRREVNFHKQIKTGNFSALKHTLIEGINVLIAFKQSLSGLRKRAEIFEIGTLWPKNVNSLLSEASYMATVAQEMVDTLGIIDEFRCLIEIETDGSIFQILTTEFEPSLPSIERITAQLSDISFDIFQPSNETSWDSVRETCLKLAADLEDFILTKVATLISRDDISSMTVFKYLTVITNLNTRPRIRNYAIDCLNESGSRLQTELIGRQNHYLKQAETRRFMQPGETESLTVTLQSLHSQLAAIADLDAFANDHIDKSSSTGAEILQSEIATSSLLPLLIAEFTKILDQPVVQQNSSLLHGIEAPIIQCHFPFKVYSLTQELRLLAASGVPLAEEVQELLKMTEFLHGSVEKLSLTLQEVFTEITVMPQHEMSVILPYYAEYMHLLVQKFEKLTFRQMGTDMAASDAMENMLKNLHNAVKTSKQLLAETNDNISNNLRQLLDVPLFSLTSVEQPLICEDFFKTGDDCIDAALYNIKSICDDIQSHVSNVLRHVGDTFKEDDMSMLKIQGNVSNIYSATWFAKVHAAVIQWITDHVLPQFVLLITTNKFLTLKVERMFTSTGSIPTQLQPSLDVVLSKCMALVRLHNRLDELGIYSEGVSELKPLNEETSEASIHSNLKIITAVLHFRDNLARVLWEVKLVVAQDNEHAHVGCFEIQKANTDNLS